MTDARALIPPQPWALLIVDDEAGLHDVSRLVLKRLSYGGRAVEIISAYSAAEARAIIEKRRDIAVALVDVVMEDDQAGLALVRDMREVYGMNLTRIILRTGNPGLAPEREVIQHFQIDDYRDKTELTSDRLFTSAYTALRAYQMLVALEQTAEGLERIITFSGRLEVHAGFLQFLEGVLTQLAAVADAASGLLLIEDVMATSKDASGPTVVFATGQYQSWTSKPLSGLADPAFVTAVDKAMHENVIQVREHGILMPIEAPDHQRFTLWIPTAGRPESHVLRLLQIFREKLRLSVENVRLQDQILEAQRTALGKLCEAVEMRSKETGQHIQRMSRYSRLLATLCGLPTEQVQLIEAAAPLHDIGKVSIPDSILNKPGSLTPEEMEVMRGHARNGYDLLSDSRSDMLRLGAEIALTHHERWDGTGYPRGLKGEEIPLHGRIVCLADVFDALMSKRVYKEAFSFEKTTRIISEGSGKFFDPRLVELLLANGDQFKEIFRSNPDQP